MKTIRVLILISLSIGLLSISCKKEEELVIIEGENSLIYLDENGVTIKAYDIARAGDTDILEGVTYTVVDSAMLYAMVDSVDDYSKVVTSLVTNMSGLFSGSYYMTQMRMREFNQDISIWDVSNVTDMSGMFSESTFNNDISNWNVGNVKDMGYMFYCATSFNQDLSDWDVINVTNMSDMFSGELGWGNTIYTSFNQDISEWYLSSYPSHTSPIVTVSAISYFIFKDFPFRLPKKKTEGKQLLT